MAVAATEIFLNSREWDNITVTSEQKHYAFNASRRNSHMTSVKIQRRTSSCLSMSISRRAAHWSIRRYTNLEEQDGSSDNASSNLGQVPSNHDEFRGFFQTLQATAVQQIKSVHHHYSPHPFQSGRPIH